MTKKWMALFIAVTLVFTSVLSYAEKPAEEQEEEVGEFMEELGETSQSFTIPINIGPVYSVIIRHDGIGIALSMIKSKSISLALEAVSFFTNLKEMDIHLENGKKYTIPAVVQILNQKVGTFIVFNVTEKAATSILDIISSGSPVVRFSFIQNNDNRIDMTVDEVNEAMTKATGEATDIVNQAGEAADKFWKNFSAGIGKYAEDTYADLSKALADAGDFLSNAANDLGKSLTDTANSAGEFIGSAMESAGESIGEAMESAGESIGEAMENLGNLWNGLWGK